MRAAHQPDEMLIVLRRHQVNVRLVRQHAIHRCLDLRIQVHRVDKLHIGVAQGKVGEGLADVAETIAEILPPMAGDQHHPPIVIQHRQR